MQGQQRPTGLTTGTLSERVFFVEAAIAIKDAVKAERETIRIAYERKKVKKPHHQRH